MEALADFDAGASLPSPSLARRWRVGVERKAKTGKESGWISEKVKVWVCVTDEAFMI
jgi:hypothetical protein